MYKVCDSGPMGKSYFLQLDLYCRVLTKLITSFWYLYLNTEGVFHGYKGISKYRYNKQNKTYVLFT